MRERGTQITHICFHLFQFTQLGKNVAVEFGVFLVVLFHLLLQDFVLHLHISEYQEPEMSLIT